ncbi:N-acetylgalactosamine-6-phosphate deacetylase [bioreactor metagenome]|uniref:N-acetylgalactosamine-6-phosphate deacetylase n=1 Tax=bioreactor metagenome TaxID=1076179 RepID=A0A644YZE2_9ZZZZ
MAISIHHLPGFVDLQVNGFLGVDYSADDLTLDKVRMTALEINRRGTAGFLATVITSSDATYEKNLGLIARAMTDPEIGRIILGIHAEGPFLSDKPGAVGAHNPRYVKKPSVEFFKKMLDWSHNTIKVLTIAAENEGAEELTRYAVSRGVVVSLGHHLADYAAIQRCAAAGASWLTHLGNGVPNEVNRHFNPIWAGLAEDKVAAGLITDGHHLPPHVVKTMIRAKGVDHVIFVSDASPIAGMPPGRYETLGNLAILEPNGYLHNPEKKCLVGSSATILECANVIAGLKAFSPEEIVQMGLIAPLRKIGIDPEKFVAERPDCCGWNDAEGLFRMK